VTLIDTTGGPLANPWQYPGQESELTQSSHSIVRLAQWETYRQQFGSPASGVWIAGEQDPADFVSLLDEAKVIVVEFPKSRDGRGFTLARVLRSRCSYKGDVRAAGPLLPDQFSMLIQCGFSSLLAPSTVPLVRWRDAAAAIALARNKPRTLLDRLSHSRQA